MRANQLQKALESLSKAIRDVDAALVEMRAEPDPLALHIFVSRRRYRNMPDIKSGHRSEMMARTSWHQACELGFRGTLNEWERLLGAPSRR
jgi:hypothetical protein